MFEILDEIDSRTEGDTAGCFVYTTGFYVECGYYITIGTAKK